MSGSLVGYTIGMLSYGMKKLLLYKAISDISLIDSLIFIQYDDFSKMLLIGEFYQDFISVSIFISYVFQYFILTVFLEYIELNFCGLSDNLQSNIMQRGIKDQNFILDDDEEKIEIDNNYYVNMVDHSQEENINN